MATMKHPVEDTIRVLFIEDDPAVAEMYKLKLELDGYQVKVVSNDDQVMQEAAALRPDMIFLDLRMGEELGIATLQRLRATDGTRHLPVIILSSRAAQEMADGLRGTRRPRPERPDLEHRRLGPGRGELSRLAPPADQATRCRLSRYIERSAAASKPSGLVPSAGKDAVPIDTEMAPAGSSASRNVPPTRRASETAPT